MEITNKNKYSYAMSFVHHWLRAIKSKGTNKGIFFFASCLIFAFSKKHREKYYEIKKFFENPQSFLKIKEFFINRYKDKNLYSYKFDGTFGEGLPNWLNFILAFLFDHDNSKLEFYMFFGDCDDMAEFAKRVLELSGFDAIRIGVIGPEPQSWHYDCLFRDTVHGTGMFMLFNYGNVIFGRTVEDCVNQLYSSFYKIDKDGKYKIDAQGERETMFPKGKTKWWRCKW